MNSKHYDSDLTEAEFAILEPLLPTRKTRGRLRSAALREILDAIFYVLRGGVPWRMLPDGFPPWKTAFHYFRQWRLSGLWEAINAALRERVREGMGRTALRERVREGMGRTALRERVREGMGRTALRERVREGMG